MLRERVLPLAQSALLAALSAFAVLLAAPPARADLSADAERIVKMWSARGARVTRLSPVFLEHGRVRAVPLGPSGRAAPAGAAPAGTAPAVKDRAAPPGKPPVEKGGAGSGINKGGKGGGEKVIEKDAGPGKGPSGCMTVVLLAPRTAEFLVETEEPDRGVDALQQLMNRNLPRNHPPALDANEERRLRSAAGSLTLSRCGAERDGLRRLMIELSGARSALEVIVAESADKLGDLREILPERASGPVAPRGDPGRPLEPGPIAERLARAEKRARSEGAESVTRVSMRASAAGTGEFSLRLAEGCHRLEVMAEVPALIPRRATDVDAEARESETERQLARDRADAPDARLDFCVGEATVVDVPFLGAAGPVGVTISDARWPTPRMVPAHWGARARGGLSTALRRRGAPNPQSQPILEAIGVQGETSVPFEVEPGKCYLAAVALLRGEARGIRLAGDLGSRMVRDEVGERPESAAVAFCADLETSAVLRVEARGSAPWWVLVVWPM